MAITINQEPSGYQSAHEEVWHVVESTNKAVAGFQYVFDIYKQGEFITRIKNTPYNNNQLGILDVSSIVRSSLNTEALPDITFNNLNAPTIMPSGMFFTDYEVRYGEVSGGVLTQNIASGSYRVYNTYNRLEFDKKRTIINKNIFLTNRPNVSFYNSGKYIILTALIDSGSGDDAVEATITRKGESNYLNAIYTNINKVYIYNFTPPINIDKFTLYSVNDGETGSLSFQFKCNKYETHNLVFLNALGGFESFEFVHGKMINDIEKKSFDQQRFKISNNLMLPNIPGITNNVGVFNEEKKIYSVKYKSKMQLTSDILNTEEWNWLSELVNSPLVYYYDSGNSSFYPVQITDTNYEFKDDLINKADNLVVNIDFSISNHTQFR